MIKTGLPEAVWTMALSIDRTKGVSVEETDVTTVRVGGRQMPRDEAIKFARNYLGAQPPLRWSYPAYDSYEAERARGPLTEADLLAPALLNVQQLSLRAYYQLLEALPRLSALLDELEPELSLAAAQPEQLQAIGVLYAVLDDSDVHGTRGTRLSKILHRKRPALIPLYDEQVRRCYQDGEGAPVPPVNGRGWADFMRAFAGAVQHDLVTQLDTWEEIAGFAAGPPITPLRALDIVAWRAGARS